MTADGSQELKCQLMKCREVISVGYNTESRIEWLNNFCGYFYEFADRLHKYISTEVTGDLSGNEHIDITFLCLAQVCLCTKYLERVIRAEETAGKPIPSSRTHFIDRINLCLDKLVLSTRNLEVTGDEEKALQQSRYPFFDLLEIAMDHIKNYSNYQESLNDEVDKSRELKDAFDSSKEVHQCVRFMISQALALANVALIEDKTAISAFSQKVLQDSTAFQQECQKNFETGRNNESIRSLKALALAGSINKLHKHVDETVLRLIFICFSDLEKFSLDKLRAKIHKKRKDDAELDEFIADFDVNMDRLAQIGLFASNETNKPKLKTLVRSCMASLEALDSCIIPSLQASKLTAMHSEILEQHFYEEIKKLKTAIFDIVDAAPLIRSYFDLLNSCVAKIEKNFNKSQLDDILQMGEFVLQFFQYPSNKKILQPTQKLIYNRLEHFQKYKLMLKECRAILVCAGQVDHKRIVKRFKILRGIMQRFADALEYEYKQNEPTKRIEPNLTWDKLAVGENLTIDLNETQFQLESIEPSICSILYRNESDIFKSRKRALSESMYGNNSRCSPTTSQEMRDKEKQNLQRRFSADGPNKQERSRVSLRRKESLRTTMFKRQKSLESRKACNFYLQNSASLQISEILDQISEISSNNSIHSGEDVLNKTRIG
uniref:Serendipity locus protein alpha n=1 Tax=Ceratitis capitata TaxID=7213 RepID=W8CBJ1_CERCA